MFSFECWPVFKLECTANTTLVYDVTWLVFWKLSTIVSRLTMFQLKKTLDSLCIPLSIYLHTKLRRIQISAYVAKYGTSFLPTPSFCSFLFKSLLRPWRETHYTNVAYFEGWRLLNSELLGVDISLGWYFFGKEMITLGWFKSWLVEVLRLIIYEGNVSFPNYSQSSLVKEN